MNKIAVVVLTILLSACSSIFPNSTKDTRAWQTADCSGAAGWDVCTKKAKSHCPNGFEIANKQENMVTGLRSFEFSCRK